MSSLLNSISLGLQASTGRVQGMTSCDPCSPWVQLVATTIFGQGVEWKLHAILHFGSESSTLFSPSGAKVPGDESSMERKFQGAKVPGNESSTHGTFAPGSESTWERKFQLPQMSMEGRIWEIGKFWVWNGRMMGWWTIIVVMMTLARWDDRGEEMNQEEADQDVADEVSEEVDSRGKVMRSEKDW